jgi:hypothetical protein
MFTVQVQVTLCKGSVSSDLTSKKFEIVPAPTILLSVTLGGSSTMSQISKQVQQKLIAAVASSLAISSELVQIISAQNAARRMLAVEIAFRIFTIDAADAAKLQQRVKVSDIQVLIRASCQMQCMQENDGLDTYIFHVGLKSRL